MKIFFILPFLLISLYSQTTPQTFSKFGDVIYLNAPYISKLQNIPQFKKQSKTIKKYIADVEKTKVYGFDLETGLRSNKVQYLKKLRRLVKINDYFIRSVKNKFYYSIEKEDSSLFQSILDSGLLDIQSHKEEIVNYYYLHKNNIVLSATIKKIITDDNKLNKKIKNQVQQESRKKVFEEKSLQKIRDNQNQKSDVLKHSIEDSLKNTKN